MIPTLSIRPVALLGSRQNYRPMPFRPAPMSDKALGQAGAMSALGIVPMLAMAGISGLISWAGFNWASNSKDTAPKILGYTLGGLAGLSALGSVLGAILWGTMVHAGQDATAQRAPDELLRSAQQNRAEVDRLLNQPAMTEPFSPPMNLPTTPLPMM